LKQAKHGFWLVTRWAAADQQSPVVGCPSLALPTVNVEPIIDYTCFVGSDVKN
jgi:hypothetical protein